MDDWFHTVRLYWRNGRRWNLAWYETVAEIVFMTVFRVMRWDRGDT